MKTTTMHLSRTLEPILLATLVLAAIVMLLPRLSEAAVFRSVQVGAVHAGAGRAEAPSAIRCDLPLVPARAVEVRSIGRQRVVVRNEYPSAGHRAAGHSVACQPAASHLSAWHGTSHAAGPRIAGHRHSHRHTHRQRH